MQTTQLFTIIILIIQLAQSQGSLPVKPEISVFFLTLLIMYIFKIYLVRYVLFWSGEDGSAIIFDENYICTEIERGFGTKLETYKQNKYVCSKSVDCDSVCILFT